MAGRHGEAVIKIAQVETEQENMNVLKIQTLDIIRVLLNEHRKQTKLPVVIRVHVHMRDL
jgi:hypothetical protein